MWQRLLLLYARNPKLCIGLIVSPAIIGLICMAIPIRTHCGSAPSANFPLPTDEQSVQTVSEEKTSDDWDADSEKIVTPRGTFHYKLGPHGAKDSFIAVDLRGDTAHLSYPRPPYELMESGQYRMDPFDVSPEEDYILFERKECTGINEILIYKRVGNLKYLPVQFDWGRELYHAFNQVNDEYAKKSQVVGVTRLLKWENDHTFRFTIGDKYRKTWHDGTFDLKTLRMRILERTHEEVK